jgi:hypothetical protein
MVPCRACLWFLLNLGSVPLSEGYLCVLGFLILCHNPVSNRIESKSAGALWGARNRAEAKAACSVGYVPVPVVLLRLVMLRGVL